MAAGTCTACGNAVHECECPDRSDDEPYRERIELVVSNSTAHEIARLLSSDDGWPRGARWAAKNIDGAKDGFAALRIILAHVTPERRRQALGRIATCLEQIATERAELYKRILAKATSL